MRKNLKIKKIVYDETDAIVAQQMGKAACNKYLLLLQQKLDSAAGNDV